MLGSKSVRSWQAISEPHMMIALDPDTAVVDPFNKVPTLCVVCNILGPMTKQH